MNLDFIAHEGVAHDKNPPGRGSGRYAWGSGENPEQHSRADFLAEVKRLKKMGIPEAKIAEMLLGYKVKDNGEFKLNAKGEKIPYSSNDLRARVAIETKEQQKESRQKAIDLYDKYGNKSMVAREMGVSEGTVRNLLNDALADRSDKYNSTAERLKQICDEKGVIDVGVNTEMSLGVTKNTKNVALKMLEDQGYKIAYVNMPQLTTQHNTTIMCLVSPDIDYKSVFDVKERKIYSIDDYSPDGGKTWQTTQYPEAIDSSRIFVRFGDQGGKDKDGVIELRKGVEDISLGDSLYSQVRINVDNKGFMKGMAIYSDEIPEGYDIVYNTNKKTGTKIVPELGEDGCVMKSLKTIKEGPNAGQIDRDNPFGALIKAEKTDTEGNTIKAGGQSYYISEDGTKKLRVINKLSEEGDWDNWSKTLSSQFLSKQPIKLIKQQLDYTISEKKVQLEEIKNLTNPIVKQQLLDNFAGKCDSNAADLSALGFKNQAFQVLLPVPKLKDNEVYAPNYKDGEKVALIRYPHGGTFEIPILTVNNKSKDAKAIMENAKDAIGINQNVAERLSGADFDGDSAVVIPMTSNNLKIISTDPLKELEGWDNKEGYKLPDSAPPVTNSTKQREMGIVTNLITDMTVGGADTSDIAKAVKHSMVVIDSEKHHLDYIKSYKDNDIQSLKETYQGHEVDGEVKFGASTILSRAKSEARVNERKEVNDLYKMTPEEQERWKNGEIIFRETGNTKKKLITNPKDMTSEELEKYNAGKKVWRQTDDKVTQEVHQMDIVDDAMELVRDKNNVKEVAYAEFANDLKSLAKDARKTSRAISPNKVDPVARQTYAKEVESLKQKVRDIEANSPKERQATTIANAIVSEKFAANPDMDYEHKQRVRAQAMDQARAMVGAKKPTTNITDKEWEAIQSNAISSTNLKKLISNMDQGRLIELATPKTKSNLTDAQIALAKSMKSSGMYTYADIAERLGVSTSTISKIV